jgi:hypothetical protein
MRHRASERESVVEVSPPRNGCAGSSR